MEVVGIEPAVRLELLNVQDRQDPVLEVEASVGANTINRFEAGQDARVSRVDKMRAALEAAGVEFIPQNGGGAGVRMRQP